MAELLALEYLLRRDRLIVAIGLGAVVALAWAYLFAGAGIDMSMADMVMDMPMPWSPSYAALMFTMWWVMMIAMMVPSAALPWSCCSRQSGGSKRQRFRPSWKPGYFSPAIIS